MELKRKCVMIVMVAALFGISMYANGCKKSEQAREARAAESVALCMKCGQIRGTMLCCKPNQPVCSACGFVKDSPACCNVPRGTLQAAICCKCGQIKDSELCCKPDQTLCAMCGLVKDSPGCCKIPKM